MDLKDEIKAEVEKVEASPIIDQPVEGKGVAESSAMADDLPESAEPLTGQMEERASEYRHMVMTGEKITEDWPPPETPTWSQWHEVLPDCSSVSCLQATTFCDSLCRACRQVPRSGAIYVWDLHWSVSCSIGSQGNCGIGITSTRAWRSDRGRCPDRRL